MSDYEMFPTFELSLNDELAVRVQCAITVKSPSVYEINVREITCLESGKDWTIFLDHQVVMGYIWGCQWILREAVE